MHSIYAHMLSMACEMHSDWRNDIEGLGKLCANHIPDYQNLMTAFNVKQLKQAS